MNILFDYEYLNISYAIDYKMKEDLEKIRSHFTIRIKPLESEINKFKDHAIVFNVLGNIRYADGIEPPFVVCYKMPIELGDKINGCIDASDAAYLRKLLNIPPLS